MSRSSRHRLLIAERGTPEQTADAARALLTDLDDDAVLWVGSEAVRFETTSARGVRKILGRSFDAVVVDLHDGLDADVLGQCHGFVWGGGALVLRLPPAGEAPTAANARFAAFPHDPADVTDRLWRRFMRIVDVAATTADRLRPAKTDVGPTADQDRVVAAIERALAGETPATVVVLADRGRGKSAAVGRALAGFSGRVAVTAGHRDAVQEVLRFAGDDTVEWRTTRQLATASEAFDVIVVDEAAQLPVPVLQALVRTHRDASFVFATTTHGYEGTGRGFQLRFMEWLTGERDVEQLELTEPIRWGAGDPLERAVFDALLLDAEPAQPPDVIVDVRHELLDRDALVADERLLSEFFGLLIQAHYRTTPGDLHRMLDAPNLDLHALFADDAVVGASLVAREGGWPDALCRSVYDGDQRVRGHALPETLVAHLGHREAGRLDMVRSVRIAVHPDARRRGLGSELVEAVESTYAPDLFGTLFGATSDLIAFRRQLGYRVVRMSSSRGARTGEPSVAMIKPGDASGGRADFVESLRAEFARDLPVQLSLMAAEEDLVELDALADTLQRGVHDAADLSDDELERTVFHYVDGPRTWESAATALERYIADNRALLPSIEPVHRRLLEARAEHRSWSDTAEHAGLPSVPAAMRAARRAMRELVTRVSDRGGVASDSGAIPQPE